MMIVQLSSCSKTEERPTDLVTFPLKGEVVAIDSARMRVTIHHEEIPDYMMAMTMPFKVKKRELLHQLQIGDTIRGVLAVSRTESWLESITVVGTGKPPDTTFLEGAVLARLFRTGEPLPDDSLTNQEGKLIRLSSFQGKAVAMTFIYTRCPLPDFCIRMSDNFAAIQKMLAGDKSIDGRWHLLTISFDPAFDTPRVLKGYARGYGANFTTWDFAVASERTIRKLADGFGLTLADDGGLISHNLRTALIDREGRLVKVINGNEWTAEEVVTQIKNLIPD
jgi:protein SCO1/2